MEKQQAGAAWGELVIRNSDAVLTNQSPTASRMGSVGHVLGYGAGALDLVSIFGKWMGDTQFKQLTIIATLLGSHRAGSRFKEGGRGQGRTFQSRSPDLVHPASPATADTGNLLGTVLVLDRFVRPCLYSSS
jgi:hypothetical protein